MIPSKRVLALLAAAGVALSLVIGVATGASSGPKGSFHPPKPTRAPTHQPPRDLPQAAVDAMARGETAQVAPDYDAMAADLGLTGDAAKAFVERSKRMAQTPPIVGEGPGPAEGKTPTRATSP